LEALLVVILVPYYVGGLVSVFVYPWRAGLNIMAYVGAFAHEPSRRNGIPWVIKTFVKMSAWPIVFGVWLRDGRPPSRVVFGPDAAERFGRPGDYLPGFQTKWKDPEPWLKPRPSPEPPSTGSRLQARAPTGRALSRRNEPDRQLIIDFGRHQFLGWEAAGESGAFEDWYGRTAVWHEQLMHGPPGRDRAIDQLNQLATNHGGWVAIDAWKLILEFSTGDAAVSQGALALDACVQEAVAKWRDVAAKCDPVPEGSEIE